MECISARQGTIIYAKKESIYFALKRTIILLTCGLTDYEHTPRLYETLERFFEDCCLSLCLSGWPCSPKKAATRSLRNHLEYTALLKYGAFIPLEKTKNFKLKTTENSKYLFKRKAQLLISILRMKLSCELKFTLAMLTFGHLAYIFILCIPYSWTLFVPGQKHGDDRPMYDILRQFYLQTKFLFSPRSWWRTQRDKNSVNSPNPMKRTEDEGCAKRRRPAFDWAVPGRPLLTSRRVSYLFDSGNIAQLSGIVRLWCLDDTENKNYCIPVIATFSTMRTKTHRKPIGQTKKKQLQFIQHIDFEARAEQRRSREKGSFVFIFVIRILPVSADR